MKLRIAGAIAVAIAVPSVAVATTVRPTIRIEGGTGTVLPETGIPLSNAGTTVVADTTDTDTITVAKHSATAQAGRAAGWFGFTLGFDLFDFGGPSSFITQLGADKMPASFEPSWRLKVNNKITATGSDTTNLANGDEATWSFVAKFTDPELDVTASRRIVKTGDSVKVRVTSYDNDGVGTPAAGAKVQFAGLTRTTGASGEVTFTPTAPGSRFVTATLAGAVRSPKRLVCVYTGSPAPCSAITAPVQSSAAIPGVQAIAGLATAPAVQVSIARLEGQIQQPGAIDPDTACRFLQLDRTTFAPSRDCAQTTWIPLAVQNGHWTLTLPGTTSLPAGRYVVRSRAIAGTRKESRAVTAVNVRRFTVAEPAA